MLEKLKRQIKLSMQDRTSPNTVQDLIQRYDLENNTEQNFLNKLIDKINKVMDIKDNGDVDFKGNITQNGQPFKSGGGDTVPIGTMIAYPSDVIPDNWLLCDGREVSRTEYSELFAVLGTSHGAGDGITTFNLPNTKGRVIAGKDGTTEFANIGTLYGAKTHRLTVGQLPAHGHTGTTSWGGDHSHAVSVAITGGSDAGNWDRLTLNGWGASRWWGNSAITLSAGGHNHTITVGNTGSGEAHNNVQPTISENYIIKAK
jgi:microcystin-dependent protein